MSLYADEQSLFERWEKKTKPGETFVRDGVMCETTYNASDPKIAFILKEPNGDNGGHLRNSALVIGGGWGRTWGDITRWTYGIRHRNNLTGWSDAAPQYQIGLKDHRHDERQKILQSICAINLKKVAGGSSSNNNEIAEFARADQEELREQYNIYQPDLTICCGSVVGILLKEIMEHKVECQVTERGAWYYEWSAGKYVIDFVHPASRSLSRLMFYDLVDTVNTLLK